MSEQLYREVTDDERQLYVFNVSNKEVQTRLTVPVEPDYEAAENTLDDWLNELWADERTVYEGAKAIVDAALKGTDE